jgi:hypothetical protein
MGVQKGARSNQDRRGKTKEPSATGRAPEGSGSPLAWRVERAGRRIATLETPGQGVTRRPLRDAGLGLRSPDGGKNRGHESESGANRHDFNFDRRRHQLAPQYSMSVSETNQPFRFSTPRTGEDLMNCKFHDSSEQFQMAGSAA